MPSLPKFPFELQGANGSLRLELESPDTAVMSHKARWPDVWDCGDISAPARENATN